MFLGVDLGTSSLKAGLFASDGQCLRRWRIAMPAAQVAGNRVELDPHAWWTALRTVLAEAPDATALSISGLTNTHVLVGQDGAPLRPAISWADTRSSDLGTDEPTVSVAARLTWLERFEPEVLQRARSVLFAKDFLVQRLTGQYVGDSVTWRSWVGPDDGWGPRFPQRFRHLLPRLVAPGEALGGSPLVVVGVPDSLAAALGAGAVNRTDAWVIAGSSETAGLWLDPSSPVRAPARFPFWGSDVVAMASSVGGITHAWASRLWPSRTPVPVRADAVLARPADRPTPVFLPNVFGERAPEWNPEARGALLALGGETDADDIWAAVTESIAFVQRQLLAALSSAGDPVGRVILTGGPAQGRSRGQLLADALGEPVLVARDVETGVRGSAILALQAAHGLRHEDAVRTLAPGLTAVEPRPAHSAALQERYGEFVRMTRAVTGRRPD